MMDDFLPNEDEIVQRVDEYTLYCFYLEHTPELGVNYSSPLRLGDTNPSFGIFQTRYKPNRELFWKDSGGHSDSGDVFKLIRLLYGYTRLQALQRVRSDFGLGPLMETAPKIRRHALIHKEPVRITTVCRTWKKYDLSYWSKFNVTRKELDFYHVSALSCYWLRTSQPTPSFPGGGIGYDYQIRKGKHQLYFPMEAKQFKFRSDDAISEEVFGLQELDCNHCPLIITKSYKDIMCLRSFGYQAVAPPGEHTMIHPEHLQHLQTNYSDIAILFDNDGKHDAHKYEQRKIWVPADSGEKDISDFCKRYGPAETAALLKTIV